MSSPRMQADNDDRINRVKQHFGSKGKSPPVIQPKPTGRRLVEVKPSSTAVSSPSIIVTQQNGRRHSDSDTEDPGHITLDPQSLAQFGRLDAEALDAVKRYHILDSAAQRQKAHLSHGKGLQSRRLPSQFAGKVSDDYYDQRKSFDPLMASKLTAVSEDIGRARSQTHDAVGLDVSTSPALTDAEREQNLMRKVGAPHGSAIAGLASLFKKSPKLPRSTSSNLGTPPATRAKPRKASTPESPSVTSLKKFDSSPSPHSSFKFKFRRKKGRLSRESSSEDVRGSVEDLRSETSSICSASKFSIKEEEFAVSPKKEIISPQALPEPNTQVHSTKSPGHTVSPIALATQGDVSNRGSLLFKEPTDVPSLFEETPSLFDTSELDSILTKSTTVFKTDSSNKVQEKLSPLPKPKKTNESNAKLPPPAIATKKPALKPTKKSKVDLSMYEKKPSATTTTSSTTSAKQKIALFEDKQTPKPTARTTDEKTTLNSPIKKSTSPVEQQLAPEVAQVGDKAKPKLPPSVKEGQDKSATETGRDEPTNEQKPMEELPKEVEQEEVEKPKVMEKKEMKPKPAVEEKTKDDKSVKKDSQKPCESKTKEHGDQEDQPSWKLMLEERQKKRQELKSEKKEGEVSKPSGSSLFSDASVAQDSSDKQLVKDQPKANSDTASKKASLFDDELFQDEVPIKDQKASLFVDESLQKEIPTKDEKTGVKKSTSTPSTKAATEKGKVEPHSPLLFRDEEKELKEQTKTERPDEEEKEVNLALFGSDSERFASKISSSPKTGCRASKTEAMETKKLLPSQPTGKEKKKADSVEAAVHPLGGLDEEITTAKESDDSQKEKQDVSKPADDDLFGENESTEPLPHKPESKEDKKVEEVVPAKDPSPATKTASSRAGKTVETKPQLSQTKEVAGKPSWLQALEDKKVTKSSPTEKGPPKSPVKISRAEGDDKPHWKKMLEEKRKAREQGGMTAAKQTSSSSPSEEKAKEEDKKTSLPKVTLKAKIAPAEVSAKTSTPGKDKPKPPPLKPVVSQNEGDKKPEKSSVEHSPTKEGQESKETTPLATPTTVTETVERKSPGSRETSPRHVSPSTDSNIPKWKQDLLAKKRASGGGPLSPRRTSTESQDKKEEKIPAWKQELLAAKKKKLGSTSEPASLGVASRSSTVSVPGRGSGRSQQQPKEVPSFMQEFQKKKRTT